MTDPIASLLDNLNRISSDFQSVAELKQETRSKEVETLEAIINRLLPILKFVDQNIHTKYYEDINKCRFKDHEEKGILLKNDFSKEYTGDYPHQDNYWNYEGDQIWLTRSGKIILVERTGEGSAWQRDSCEWTSKITEISIQQLINETGFESVIESMRQAIESAIKENEKKKPILEKRINVLAEIQDKIR